MTDVDLVDRNPADVAAPYPRLMDRPTSDAEWTERILAQIANPSMLGATPDTDPIAGELARLRVVDPPIRSLGDEMVLFAAGLASGGALPIGIRALGSSGAVFRGLTAEAEQALAAYARSMMNRLGRMPTAGEVLGSLKVARPVIEGINHAIQHASAPPRPIDQDQQSDWSSSNARWDVDPSGQAVVRPGYSSLKRTDADAQPGVDLDAFFDWIVTQAQERAGKANDRWKAKPGRSFQTYLKDQISLPKHYVGRTSGYESPERNVHLRDLDGYPSEDFYRAVLDRTSDRYSSIRGREQMVLDWLRARGIAANTDNAISPLNPLRSYYMRNAEHEFGLLPPSEGKR